MSTFDRIEEHRELVAGLEYEEWSERICADEEEPDEDVEESECVAA